MAHSLKIKSPEICRKKTVCIPALLTSILLFQRNILSHANLKVFDNKFVYLPSLWTAAVMELVAFSNKKCTYVVRNVNLLGFLAEGKVDRDF